MLLLARGGNKNTILANELRSMCSNDVRVSLPAKNMQNLFDKEYVTDHTSEDVGSTVFEKKVHSIFRMLHSGVF